jgi:hypothetical protein
VFGERRRSVGSVDDGQRAELGRLWGELGSARSRGREAWLPVASAIVRLSREAGALSWDEVPPGLVADGSYERLMAAAGVPFTLPQERTARLS